MSAYLCAQSDPEAWFPELGRSAKTAKRICARCDAQTACLAEAMANPEVIGIWGGTTEDERKQMREAAA